MFSRQEYSEDVILSFRQEVVQYNFQNLACAHLKLSTHFETIRPQLADLVKLTISLL